jgi:hypothetical protein
MEITAMNRRSTRRMPKSFGFFLQSFSQRFMDFAFGFCRNRFF